MANEDTKVFHYGESVIMADGDRHFDGVVVAAFRDRSSGKWCYVDGWPKAFLRTTRTRITRSSVLPVGRCIL